jgi:hypothetical protein
MALFHGFGSNEWLMEAFVAPPQFDARQSLPSAHRLSFQHEVTVMMHFSLAAPRA